MTPDAARTFVLWHRKFFGKTLGEVMQMRGGPGYLRWPRDKLSAARSPAQNNLFEAVCAVLDAEPKRVPPWQAARGSVRQSHADRARNAEYGF